MEEILFTKMHGLGNDYIYINCLASIPHDIEQLAIEMSRPHTGIASDGIIIICPSDVADFKMRIFNADGSEARMCGNGSRCVAKYLHDYGICDKSEITLETLGGIKTLHLIEKPDGTVDHVVVDMGRANFSSSEIPANIPADEMINYPLSTRSGRYTVTGVSVGNPHGVVIVDDPAKIDLADVGPQLENNPVWPQRANIEFIAIHSPSELTMRVWERGSGETMACGTGACASVAAGRRLGLLSDRVTVHLPGGDLQIEIAPDGHILMTGPASTVFEGRYFRLEYA